MDLLVETGEVSLVYDPSGVGETARILLVGDDRASLLVAEMLRAEWPEGMVLTQVSTLRDATQEMLERHPSCVVLDLSSPGTDVPGAVAQVRTASPETAVVVIVDESQEPLSLATISAGAQDFLVRHELTSRRLYRAVRFAIERGRSEVALAHQALHDPLTGLPNRALFLDRLGVALDRSRRTNASIAVLFLDVDNFKQINDSLGHAAGDRLLADLAKRLLSMLRPMDTVARFGGDEFTFLFEDLASEREVVLIAERISRMTSLPIRLEEGDATVTVSIGIAMVADPNIPAETVIREADAAMYRAKELGRSRYELFDEASRQRAMERLELEAALRLAVERSELCLHYQPKVSLNGRTGVIGFEALLRWQHPERGLIAPGEFMAVAEETGLVTPIGEYVLGEALRQAMRWRRTKPDLTISVNLSMRELEDPALISTLAAALRESGADPGMLCIEVSETAVMNKPAVALRALQGLRTLGVRIAIDDYGTGSSSLSSLKQLPLDTLKIHESFVGALGHSVQDAPLLGAVVELGHALGLSVTAEGVETDTQLAQLRALGCDAAQGFLLGRPVPEQEVPALLVD